MIVLHVYCNTILISVQTDKLGSKLIKCFYLQILHVISEHTVNIVIHKVLIVVCLFNFFCSFVCYRFNITERVESHSYLSRLIN